MTRAVESLRNFIPRHYANHVVALERIKWEATGADGEAPLNGHVVRTSSSSRSVPVTVSLLSRAASSTLRQAREALGAVGTSPPVSTSFVVAGWAIILTNPIDVAVRERFPRLCRPRIPSQARSAMSAARAATDPQAEAPAAAQAACSGRYNTPKVTGQRRA